MLTTPDRKNIPCYKIFTKPRTWTDTLVQPKQRKRDMRFGTWNVRSLYRAGSLTAVAEPSGSHAKWEALDLKPGAGTLKLPLTVWAAEPRTIDSCGEQ